MAGGERGYCDLVMKGGIASGIVYPNAVLALARLYWFRNIGGTSAGAIAAAATAAAALGERRKRFTPDDFEGDPQVAGFEGFGAAAAELGTEGFIPSLFQPAPDSRPLYALLLGIVSRRSRGSIVRSALGALRWRMALPLLALLLAAAWLTGGLDAALVMLLPALACAAVAGIWGAVGNAAGAVRTAMFGLCPGTTQPGESASGLTDWFHDTLQRLAGQRAGQPLLFRNLWEAPREEGEPEGNAISLEMITTSLSHREPRSLPLQKVRFWFRRDDFLRLFPEEVVDWMIAWRDPIVVGGETYHRLPTGGEMPVLVAMRMSLSFPILLSAVPLWEEDWGATPGLAGGAPQAPDLDRRARLAAMDALAAGGRQGGRGALAAGAEAGGGRVAPAMRACWFSDGGISSNLPLHLFDAPLPRWPTFAIDLVDDATPADLPSPPPSLPAGNNEGWRPHYHPIGTNGALAGIASFLIGIVATMQSWRDLLQSRAPGHRDRIVRVPMKAHEGGINLAMTQDVLDAIAAKGASAGAVLCTDFDFNNHWWIRWRNAASAVERFTIRFAAGAGTALTPSYEDALASARTGMPAPPSYRFGMRAMRTEAQARFAELERQGLAWSARPDFLTEDAPKPLPELRIVPIF